MTDWESWAIVSRYIGNRHRYSDLLPIEKKMLPNLVRDHASVLDVGCASGGMFNIMRGFNPDLRYVGVDLSETALSYARQRYPEVEFIHGDAADLPFDDHSFALVHSRGVLCHAPDWKPLLHEMLRVASVSVLFDVRLSTKARVVSHKKIDAPYVLVLQEDFETTLGERKWELVDKIYRDNAGEAHDGKSHDEAVYLVKV